MEFDEALEEFDRLWFFSNVLSKSTQTHFRIPTSPESDSDNGFIDVCQRVRSWLDDSVEAAIAATAEEEEKAAESECTKGLENLEQSTLIALLMSAPVNSIKPPAKNPDGDRGRGKGEKSKRKVKKELSERKRSVLREVQSGFGWQLQKCGIRPEPNQVWETRFGAKKGYVF